jgi:hypothetical protein
LHGQAGNGLDACEGFELVEIRNDRGGEGAQGNKESESAAEKSVEDCPQHRTLSRIRTLLASQAALESDESSATLANGLDQTNTVLDKVHGKIMSYTRLTETTDKSNYLMLLAC